MLTANTPHVVHETIDGETILLHLKTGNYYSFDALGALIWQSIIESGSIKELMSKDLLDPDQINEVDAFVNRLVEEELLKEISSIENVLSTKRGSLLCMPSISVQICISLAFIAAPISDAV